MMSPEHSDTGFASNLEGLAQVDVPSLNLDFTSRRKALKAARALCVKLESPMDTIINIVWHIPALNAALKVGMDMKVFGVLADGGFHGVAGMAEPTKADPVLVRRMVRHLAAMGALRQNGPDSYGSTPLSDALAENVAVGGGIDFWFNMLALTYSTLPKYLAEHKYMDPVDPKDGNWQFSRNTPLQMFDWLNERPEALQSFANCMAGYAIDSMSWVDLYPTERIITGADPEGTLLVDVGGGLGQDVERFRKNHPEAPGKLVVQDQPLVIVKGKKQAHESIEMVVHDFFTEQPLKSKCSCYYFHCVLHDWNDEDTLKILRNLKPAFKKGYSKLLVNECVIPMVDANPQATGLDIILMAHVSGRERDYSDWERLLGEAGYKITGIWGNETAMESVIEAELA